MADKPTFPSLSWYYLENAYPSDGFASRLFFNGLFAIKLAPGLSNHPPMNKIYFSLLTTLLLAPLAALQAAIPIPENPLSSLKPEHPRLLATASDFARLKATIKSDPLAEKMSVAVIRQADAILNQPLPQHVLPDGKRLLQTSRDVKERMQTLGLAWQLTGDKKYPERAWKDLEAAGNFPDWNPPHFLDTAEMTRGFAIALDWMNEAWLPAQREQICRWIINLGLQPALDGYRDPKTHNGHQLRSTNNWGQVTNGGIGMGALAIADLHPKEAREALRYALECLQPSLSRYAPDGGWDEGYGYYIYAMEYATGILSSLECSLGTDFGLSKTPGYSLTPEFPLYLDGPCGCYFGFADCGGDHKISSIPYVGWVAARFANATAAASQRDKAVERPNAMGLLWLPPAAGQTKIAEPARVKAFSINAYCTLRSKWRDRDAGFVGFKAGDNKASHGHLDIGTFVYDVKGTHWAVDLGSDNYNLPDYFGKQRWTYYRLRAEGHNTFVVNPGQEPDQAPKAECPLTLCADRGNASVAVGDLGAAYPALASAKRGVRLANDGSLRIQDELDSAGKEASVLWFMHTPAKIEIASGGRSATLSRDGKILRAELVSPLDGRFESMEAAPLPSSPNPAGQKANQGITKLTVRSTCKYNQTIVVDLIPDGVDVFRLPITPLSRW